jgi:magnesium chelatase subunit I
MGMIPSITGKVELVYEGEQEGSSFVANHLISQATKTLFTTYFPKIQKLKKKQEESPYTEIINWFLEGNIIELSDNADDKARASVLDSIQPLKELVLKYQPHVSERDILFFMEFVLWALVDLKQLSKIKSDDKILFNNGIDSLLSEL